MLKQWFLGRKKKSSKYFHFSGHQRQRNKNKNTFSLPDSYLIFRTNPVYIDEIGNYANVINGQSLNVSSWCSSKCPFHLSTTCSCKPTLIYCDSCKPHFSSVYTIDTAQKSAADLDFFKIQPPIYENYVSMLPSPLGYMDDNTEKASARYYHYVETQSEDQPPQSEISPSNLNNAQDLPTSLKPSKQPLHIYMNSDFVSQIAVPNTVHAQPLIDSLDADSGHEMVEHFKVFDSGQSRLDENIHNNNATPSDISYVAHETDSLESLHIDERLFAVNGPQEAKFRSEDEFEMPETVVHENSTYEAVKDLYEKLSNSRERQMVEHAINSSYSGTAHSSMLTSQSGSSHGSGKRFKNFVGNTYETLTKHVRHSYAKLVEEDAALFKSDSPDRLFHDRNTDANSDILNQMNLRSTYIDDANGNRGSSASSALPTTSAAAKAVTSAAPEEDFITIHNQKQDSTGHNVDQFITKRDPKYGPQIDQATTLRPANKNHLCQNLRKIFRQKRYRDACKIIVTTLIGLTAFGIITALSLSINRR